VRLATSALGQKQTCAPQKGHVRFTPKSGHVHCTRVCLPKADMCGALAHVCFGPIADSCIAAKRRKLFALNVCLADNATVFVVFATDMRGEIVETSTNGIKAELEKLRCDLIAALNQLASCATVSFGVFAGAITPNQTSTL
jgi:hypothetical protein